METLVEGRIRVLTPTDRQIDVMNSDRFGKELESAIDDEHDVIVDLKNVLFLDSSALGKIVLFLRKVREARREVVFCGLNEAVAVLFRMVRLSQIATTVQDLRQAYEKLGANAL